MELGKSGPDQLLSSIHSKVITMTSLSLKEMATLRRALFPLLLISISFVEAHRVGPVKDGFYKISSILDDSVLTATWVGRPRAVITDDWKNEETQEWKVKSKLYDGLPLQLIRNELIRDNEVTKEENYKTERNMNNFAPIDWNFIPEPSGAPNVFVLNNGVGCLVNNGKGNRIFIATCDLDSTDQQWKFSYLFDIPQV